MVNVDGTLQCAGTCCTNASGQFRTSSLHSTSLHLISLPSTPPSSSPPLRLSSPLHLFTTFTNLPPRSWRLRSRHSLRSFRRHIRLLSHRRDLHRRPTPLRQLRPARPWEHHRLSPRLTNLLHGLRKRRVLRRARRTRRLQHCRRRRRRRHHRSRILCISSPELCERERVPGDGSGPLERCQCHKKCQ